MSWFWPNSEGGGMAKMLCYSILFYVIARGGEKGLASDKKR